jgi:hypothetical protein
MKGFLVSENDEISGIATVGRERPRASFTCTLQPCRTSSLRMAQELRRGSREDGCGECTRASACCALPIALGCGAGGGTRRGRDCRMTDECEGMVVGGGVVQLYCCGGW